MKQRTYFILLLKDMQLARRHIKALKGQILSLQGNPIKAVKEIYYEIRHLNNIESEINAITDEAFFPCEGLPIDEIILNERNHDQRIQKPLPGDRNRPTGGEPEI